jgi:hypothetical protein
MSHRQNGWRDESDDNMAQALTEPAADAALDSADVAYVDDELDDRGVYDEWIFGSLSHAADSIAHTVRLFPNEPLVFLAASKAARAVLEASDGEWIAYQDDGDFVVPADLDEKARKAARAAALGAARRLMRRFEGQRQVERPVVRVRPVRQRPRERRVTRRRAGTRARAPDEPHLALPEAAP